MGDRADALYLRAEAEIDEIREEWDDRSDPCPHCVLCTWDRGTLVYLDPECPLHGDRDEAIAYRQEQLAEDDASYHADQEPDDR